MGQQAEMIKYIHSTLSANKNLFVFPENKFDIMFIKTSNSSMKIVGVVVSFKIPILMNRVQFPFNEGFGKFSAIFTKSKDNLFADRQKFNEIFSGNLLSIAISP